jgi:hypothetical protein
LRDKEKNMMRKRERAYKEYIKKKNIKGKQKRRDINRGENE